MSNKEHGYGVGIGLVGFECFRIFWGVFFLVLGMNPGLARAGQEVTPTAPTGPWPSFILLGCRTVRLEGRWAQRRPSSLLETLSGAKQQSEVHSLHDPKLGATAVSNTGHLPRLFPNIRQSRGESATQQALQP